jgi:hypothetical protein
MENLPVVYTGYLDSEVTSKKTSMVRREVVMIWELLSDAVALMTSIKPNIRISHSIHSFDRIGYP